MSGRPAKRTAENAEIAAPDDRPAASTAGSSTSGETVSHEGNPPPAKKVSLDTAKAPSSLIKKVGETSSTLNTPAKFVIGPMPLFSNTFVEMGIDTLDRFFKRLYTSLITTAFEMQGYEPRNLITLHSFISVCRYLYRARIDAVFSKVSGQRLKGRIPLPPDYLVPCSMARVLNDIGTVHIPSFGVTIVPRPWVRQLAQAAASDDQAAAAIPDDLSVTHAMLVSFTALMTWGVNRGFWKTSSISGLETGTAYWLLTVRDSMNMDNPARDDTTRVSALAPFRDFSPYDAMLACVVNRNFTGDITVGTGPQPLLFACDPIANIEQIRYEFDINE